LQGTTGLADQGCGTLLAWILMPGLGPPKAGRFSSLTWARREPSVPGLFAALGIQRVPAGFAYGAGLGPNGDFPLLRPARPAPAACPTITGGTFLACPELWSRDRLRPQPVSIPLVGLARCSRRAFCYAALRAPRGTAGRRVRRPTVTWRW